MEASELDYLNFIFSETENYSSFFWNGNSFYILEGVTTLYLNLKSLNTHTFKLIKNNLSYANTFLRWIREFIKKKKINYKGIFLLEYGNLDLHDFKTGLSRISIQIN